MFASVSFDSYRPDPARPSQAEAVRTLRAFADTARGGGRHGGLRGLFGRRRPRSARGVYLDGGFGVGKTHLLASVWHAVGGAEAATFGSFVEYTNLVGALGYRTAAAELMGYRVVCIDEFELDDPGDTMMMSRLMRELADGGVSLAATSNTLPDALGEGRFAAQDFFREIQELSARFDVLRIDGDDYRHRGLADPPEPVTDAALRTAARAAAAAAAPGAAVASDDFDALMEHLVRVHPSRYRALIEGVGAVYWSGVHTLTDQGVALRLVGLVDRLYDAELPVVASGESFVRLFGAEMLAGGYRKKYLRALSRITALARLGEETRAGGTRTAATA